LDGTGFDKGDLERMQMVGFAQTLDRVHATARHFSQRRQTGTDRLPIQLDRTCTALSLKVAALFGARQAQLVPQHIQQVSGWVSANADRLTIEVKVYFLHRFFQYVAINWMA
jgi:hypothetical protein